MDQKKIGNFIADIRKKKNMTQKDLAEKLNVSITAVSKWERGICLMDMSLLKPLSKILDVSITEIINGEKDNTNIETAIEGTIDYSNQKIKKAKRKIHIILLMTIITLICIGLLSYKGLLIYSINAIENSIHEFNDKFEKEYGAPIYINSIIVDDYYTFNNLKIKNIFENKVINKENMDSTFYTIDTDKFIAISTNNTSNLLHSFWPENYVNDIVNREKYFNKLNINNDLELHKFITEFKTKPSSIFSSTAYLKEYYFECNFYNSVNYSFNKVHEIRGDLTGYVVIRENQYIAYHITNDDVEYKITFFGNFDYKETIDIISTIKIN